MIQRLITSNGAVLHVGGLDMSCLVRGATLDDGFLTIELPVKLESRQRLRSTSPENLASRQDLPPSVEISTCFTLPRPDQASPVIFVYPRP